MTQNRPGRIGWIAAAVVLIPLFMLTAAGNMRLAVADYWFRRETLPGVEKAVDLEPDSAAYSARLAAMLRESDTPASLRALTRAVALNPWDSESWIELGLRAEAAGDRRGAERDLLAAERVDKLYSPRWSLANFYFRSGELEKFWFWAKRAVELAPDDLAPLYALCWRVTDDGELVERKLGLANSDAEAGYLTYLTGQGRAEPMIHAARHLLARNRAADVPVLLAACDRLIGDDRPRQALEIWNGLAARQRIPYPVLQNGQSVANSDFRTVPSPHGFDWRLPDVYGVTASPGDSSPGLRLTFSGREPEYCDVLTAILPVAENSNYELQYLYITSGIAPGAGPRWHIADLHGGGTIAQGPAISSDHETEGQLSFQTAAGLGFARLTLAYQRALGTTRIEGSITLRSVRVVPVGHQP